MFLHKTTFILISKSIKTSFDLSSLINGSVLPPKININDLNAEYINNGQTVKINGLNLKLNKNSKNEIKAIINTGFVYNKDLKQLTGSAAGKIQLDGENIFKPENVNANIDLQLNGHKMPLLVKYENSSAAEKVLINLKNLDISPFRDFLGKDNAGLTGGVSDINISLSGKADALKEGFQKGSSTSIISDLVIKSVNIQNRGKYSVSTPYLNINLDLNKILNKKYYINKLRIDNPKVMVIKKSTPKTVASTKVSNINNVAVPKKASTIPTNAKTKQTNYDFDIKNININNLKTEVISEKKLVFSNVNIKSNQIKADTLSHIDVNLNYAIDSRLKGSINTQNEINIRSNLIPKIINSEIELIHGKNKSYSNFNLESNKVSQNNIPFTLSAEIKDLLLDPFLMAFAPAPYNKTKTSIGKLNMSMSGQNLYDPKTINGKITSTLDNISIPINVKDENVVEAIFFPLRVIAELASNTAVRFVTGNVASSMIKIDDMFNKKKRVDFKNGTLNIGLDTGVININQFDFFGTSQNPVTEMKANGQINLNNKAINLNTKTVFAGIIIPLEVKGTIQKPKTDTAKLATQLFQKNADALVNTGLDLTNTTIDTIDKIKNKNFLDLLQTPSSNNDNKKTEPKRTSTQNDISNTVNGVLDILGNSTGNSKSDGDKKKPVKLDEAIKNIFNF